MNELNVDEFLFEKYFQAWKAYVEKKSGEIFESFSSNTCVLEEEGYKESVWFKARSILNTKDWTKEDIGTGKILKKIIRAIEIPENNLLPWEPRRWNEKSKIHLVLCRALETEKQEIFERIFFNLYKSKDKDSISFNLLIKEVGKKYSLMAYLFFLKDKHRYTPIATTFFDNSFRKLGVDFKTTQRCSWDNYLTYNNILNEIKYLLSDRLQNDVSLLDAHSFVWMLSLRPFEENTKTVTKIVDDYNNLLSKKDRAAVIKARIGQGLFRSKLLKYWGSSCTISDCDENGILIASHIKPWAKCSVAEAVDVFNGLLLTPNYDKLFDGGYISFDDDGNIMLSSKLSEKNIEILGIDKNIKLKIDEQHKKYLEYHRKKYNF